MHDAVMSAMDRKVALDGARAALRSRRRSELEAALKGLPKHGRKAAKLKEKLREAMDSVSASPSGVLGEEDVAAVCVSDGIRYEFRVGEIGDIAFFKADRMGAVVIITINSAHPFSKQLAGTVNHDNPAVLSLLAAWAHYELDQSDVKRQQAIRDARIDWGRVIRRLLSADRGFHLQ